jgi:hypothetical protein
MERMNLTDAYISKSGVTCAFHFSIYANQYLKLGLDKDFFRSKEDQRVRNWVFIRDISVQIKQ